LGFLWAILGHFCAQLMGETLAGEHDERGKLNAD